LGCTFGCFTGFAFGAFGIRGAFGAFFGLIGSATESLTGSATGLIGSATGLIGSATAIQLGSSTMVRICLPLRSSFFLPFFFGILIGILTISGTECVIGSATDSAMGITSALDGSAFGGSVTGTTTSLTSSGCLA